MALDVRIKRVYDEPSDADGFRVLVDRLWPRGVTKEAAELNAWRKDLAPTPELRKDFCHDPARFETFTDRYREELDELTDALDGLIDEARGAGGRLTLIYAAKDLEHNHARVLAAVIEERLAAR